MTQTHRVESIHEIKKRLYSAFGFLRSLKGAGQRAYAKRKKKVTNPVK
jgi:hypothetical protein